MVPDVLYTATNEPECDTDEGTLCLYEVTDTYVFQDYPTTKVDNYTVTIDFYPAYTEWPGAEEYL